MQKVTAALAARLTDKAWPVITEYDLFLEYCSLYQLPPQERKQLYLREATPSRDRFKRIVRDLKKARFVRPDADFYRSERQLTRDDKPVVVQSDYGASISQHVRVFRVSDVPDGSAEDISALVDPFCVISHLSAMQYYGLTNRHPVDLILTTPDIATWRLRRDAKQEQDFSSLQLGDAPALKLQHISFPTSLRKRQVTIHTTRRTFAAQATRSGHRRVPPVEEVFVQMLDRPDLCGGMSHVIEVWHDHAADRLDKIVSAIDATSESLTKVRAGYLLDECLNLQHPVVDEWIRFAQRGGSQRLDPSQPYAPRFSAKWMISLNVTSEFIPETPGPGDMGSPGQQ
jgi:predicted transcriptional regulator of viral defense system